MKKIKILIIRFFTRKLTLGIFILSTVFILYTINNIIVNLYSDRTNIQLFFKNLIISFLIYLVLITLLLLLKLIIERIRNISGSKIRFRLTLLFIFVAFIPAIILSISSSYLINEAMERITPSETLIKPLENSLMYYRKGFSSELEQNTINLIEEIKNLNINAQNLNAQIEKIKKFDFILSFKNQKNNHQIIYIYNKGKLQQKNQNFFVEYFDDNEFSEPVIHKIDKNKWIIFTIKKINKNNNIFLVTGNILDKDKISVAEGINAIIERYKSLKIVSVSLIRDFQMFILLISLPIILLAVIFGFYLANDFTKPLNSLVEATKKISQGIYGYNIQHKASDELGQLINSFNTMSHELYLNKNRLFEAEKLAAWREVAKKLAHEVKNPLTPIKLAAERLLRSYGKDAENFKEILNSCVSTIGKEVDRLKDLVNEFSQFARFPLTNFKDENIVSLINELLSIYREANQNIEFSFPNYLSNNDVMIKIDSNQIKQVLINLIENAIESNGNKIVLETSSVIKDNKKYLKISIKDNGSGIAKKFQPNIFEPHFTSKKRGSGLGLSIVKNIIEEHKGLIYFTSEENMGTNFIIELPYNWRFDEEGKYTDNR